MVYEFKFPDVGEGIVEGRLVEWKVNIGDTIKVDDSVCNVETDKATVSIPAPVSGTVKELIGNSGEMLDVGNVFMKIETSNDSEDENSEQNEVKEESSKEIEQSQKITQNPKPISSNDNVLAMPNVKHEAKIRGIDLTTVVGTGNSGQILMHDLDNQEHSKIENNSIQNQNISKEEHIENTKTIIATPTIRKLARDMKIDISTVKGTGNNGRILKEDLENYSNQPQKEKEHSIEESKEQQTTQISANSNHISYASGIRGAIAKNMLKSLQNTAQVTLCEEINISELVTLRNKEKEALKNQGVKLTYIPFFIKAFIESCEKFPKFNALLHEEDSILSIENSFHIGVAVDTQKGLVVPVINDCEHKSIIDLAKEVVELSTKARDGKLAISEMSGGTFTISSIGALSGQFFTPILNYPQAAILGVGRIVKKPIVNSNNEIVIADMVSLSLTVDHRVIDGAEAARFLKELKEILEDPFKLFMGM